MKGLKIMKNFELKVTKTKYKNEAEEIAHHEAMRKASLYAYKSTDENLPKGYEHIGIFDNMDNGFHAEVLKKNNEIIIAYRGTEEKSIKDWLNNEQIYKNAYPPQINSAEEVYKNIRKEYPNADIVLTGHSAGGGVAAYLGAKYGIPAITFNPIGTVELLDKNNGYYDDSQVVNYCNPRDWTPSGNPKELFGKVYEVESKGFTSRKEASINAHHRAEDLEDLRTRKETTKAELQKKYEEYKKKQKQDKEIDYFKRHGRKEPIKMPRTSLWGEEHQCAGSYSVSGYTREDGTKVDGYTRTCGAKHASWRGKSLSEMSDGEVDQMLDDLI